MILQHIMKHLPISLLIKPLKNSRSLPSGKNRERDTVFLGGGGACRQANFYMVWFGLGFRAWGWGGGGSHIKMTMTLVVSLRARKCRIWSHLAQIGWPEPNKQRAGSYHFLDD